MHFSRLQDSERATRVCFLSLQGRRRSQSLQDQPVMVGNPAGVGVCGIGGKRNKEREEEKNSLAQASEASNRQLEIENTLAPVPAGRSQRQGQSSWVSYEDG